MEGAALRCGRKGRTQAESRRSEKRRTFSVRPFVGDRLKYLVARVTNDNLLRRHAGQRGAQAAHIVRKKLRGLPAFRRTPGAKVASIEQAGEPGEVPAFPRTVESGNEGGGFLDDLAVQVCEHGGK